jgi:general secretion pathway protein G
VDLELDNAGFTLIELLIVVALIGILAAIGAANLIEGQRRARYSRAAADTRQIVMQTQAFIGDNNCPPNAITDLWSTAPTCSGGGPVPNPQLYTSPMTDPWAPTATYQFAAPAVNAVVRAWSVGSDGATTAWSGAVPITGDDLGFSSQLGCSSGPLIGTVPSC